MKCKTCGSENLRTFPAEIAVHFPGPPNASEPAVFVFPNLIVCFNCGVTEFVMPEKELIQLAKGRAAGAR